MRQNRNGSKKYGHIRLKANELEGGTEESEDQFLEEKKWSIQHIAWSFGIAFVIVALATALSGLFPDTFQSAAKILLVTTIAVAIAQLETSEKLKGNLDLGLFVALFFLTIIGYMVNIQDFLSSTVVIALFCFVVIVFTLLVHAIVCRLFKIEYQYVIISIVASIADGTTSALVAASAKWKALVSIAVVLGVIGSVLGNYLGIGTAYLIKALIGA